MDLPFGVVCFALLLKWQLHVVNLTFQVARSRSFPWPGRPCLSELFLQPQGLLGLFSLLGQLTCFPHNETAYSETRIWSCNSPSYNPKVNPCCSRMKPEILNMIYEVLYGLPCLPGQVTSSLWALTRLQPHHTGCLPTPATLPVLLPYRFSNNLNNHYLYDNFANIHTHVHTTTHTHTHTHTTLLSVITPWVFRAVSSKSTSWLFNSGSCPDGTLYFFYHSLTEELSFPLPP